MTKIISGVYGIFDAEKGECLYVGQSKDVYARWDGHLKGLRYNRHRPDFTIWFWLHSSDESALDFRLLEYCKATDEALNRAETKWFYLLEPRFYGKKPSLKEKWSHTDESRRNIVEGMLKSDRYKSVLPILPRECETCKKVFTPPNKRDGKFCSRECFANNKLIHKKAQAYLEIEAICYMYLDGLSLRKISKVVGVSHITVRNILIENSIELRTQGVAY